MFTSKNQNLAAAASMAGASFLSGCISTRAPEYDPVKLAGNEVAGMPDPLSFKITKQRGDVECATAVMYTAIHFFNPESEITYEQVLEKITGDDYAHLNLGKFVSTETLKDYFNRGISEKDRAGRELVFDKLTSIEQLIKILDQGDPVIIPIMHRTIEPNTADNINTYVPRPFVKAFAEGERFVFPKYLHAIIILAACRADDGQIVFLAADPWAGIWLLSPASPNIDTITAGDLNFRWLHFDNPQIGTKAAQEYWDNDYWPRLSKLAEPGMVGIFRRKDQSVAIATP